MGANAVAPTAAAVKVASPDPPVTPVMVTTNLPVESVLPVVGVYVMLPMPDFVSVTGVLAIGFPLASSAVKVTVAGDDPSSGTEILLFGFAVKVEPTISIVACPDNVPEVTVIVAVRLMPEGPAEKVKVTCPFAFVTPEPALICPVLVAKVTA